MAAILGKGGRVAEGGGLLNRCLGVYPGPRVRIPPLPQKETSESERWEEARAEGAGVGKRARRFATNWDGTGAAKWTDLSLFHI